MRTDLFKLLADRLEEVAKNPDPKKTFDMSCWRRERSCGTVQCAAGFAADIPEIAAAGLRMVWDDTDWAPATDRITGYPQGALATVFGCQTKTIQRIFYPDYYDEDTVTTEMVIERIRETIAQAEES